MKVTREDGTEFEFDPHGSRKDTRMTRMREFIDTKGIASYSELAVAMGLPATAPIYPFLKRAIAQGWLVHVGRGAYATKSYASTHALAAPPARPTAARIVETPEAKMTKLRALMDRRGAVSHDDIAMFIGRNGPVTVKTLLRQAVQQGWLTQIGDRLYATREYARMLK